MDELLRAIVANLTIPLGDFVIIDLIAATTNAFNGALLARRPTHYRHYTLIGIVLLASISGVSGGVVRDVLLVQIPSALSNPWYLILSVVAAISALTIDHHRGSRFRESLFQFMSSFSLPWFAAIGADKALDAHFHHGRACVGTIAATAGRFIMDISGGCAAKTVRQGRMVRRHCAVDVRSSSCFTTSGLRSGQRRCWRLPLDFSSVRSQSCAHGKNASRRSGPRASLPRSSRREAQEQTNGCGLASTAKASAPARSPPRWYPVSDRRPYRTSCRPAPLLGVQVRSGRLAG